jgi:nucleotide sugar dehydrogenase
VEQTNSMNVAVIGAGKMGLPLACQLASQGARVTAVDIAPGIVRAINEGRCPIDEPGVPELLAAAVAAGRLRATNRTDEALADCEAVLVIVPALLTPERDIDASILQAVSRDIARGLRPGMLVSYETTLPVGGTRRLLLPLLEAGGLKAGADFDLVFSPERVKSRKVLHHLTLNPKVVGGITPAASARGAAFYGRYLGAPVIDAGSLEAAEMVKLAGMVYRDVNIALANELARYSESLGLDFGSLIAAANSDSESALLQPGIGVGGHCTPIYPYFLIRDAERWGIPVALAQQARAINESQPRHVLERFERSVWPLRGREVLILGLAFRPEVKEHLCSPAFALQRELSRLGARVRLHDPLYGPEEIAGFGFQPGSPEQETLPEVLLLNTAHGAYRDLSPERLARRGVRAVIDGRNLWEPAPLRAAGLVYLGIGRPCRPAAGETLPERAGERRSAAQC